MTNFIPFNFLKASDLNLAFDDTVSKSALGNQSLVGNLILPKLTASLALETQQLIVGGDLIVTSDSALTLPVGNTLQRPGLPTAGMLRCNNEAGTIEVFLPAGKWFTVQTSAATVLPSSPPVAMAGPQFGQATSSAIPLAWAVPQGGTGPFIYTVQYRLSGTGVWTLWTDSTQNLFTTISGLLPAARYEFEVTATNTAGSATSPAVATNTAGFLVGGASGLTLSAPTSTTLTVTWLPVNTTAPVAYHVEYASVGSSSWTPFDGPTTDTTLTITGLTANTSYNFHVLAKTLGSTLPSLAALGVTSPAATIAPNSPTNVQALGITSSGFTIAWNTPTAGSLPLAYVAQYQLSGTTNWTSVGTATTATGAAVTGLNSGATYNVRVLAINSAGSVTSAQISVLTLTATPIMGSGAGSATSGVSYPIITTPYVAEVVNGSAVAIKGIMVRDPAAIYSPGSLVLTVTCGTGHVTMVDSANNQISGSGTNRIIYPSTFAGVLTALGSLVYTALNVGQDNITISLADQLLAQSAVSFQVIVAATSVTPVPAQPPGGNPVVSKTATGQPTDASGSTASRMRAFLDGFGVTVALGESGYNAGYTLTQASLLENMINYLGGGKMKLLHNICNNSINASFMAMIAQNCGAAQYVLPINPFMAATELNSILAQIESFASLYPNYVFALEGQQAITSPANLANAAQFQATVYSAAHSLGLPAWQMATEADTDWNQFGQPPADVANTFVFPPYNPNGATITSIGGISGYLSTVMADAQATTPGVPTAISEFGWRSFPTGSVSPGDGFVDESTQAKYLLEFILSAFAFGGKFYLYSDLLDVAFGGNINDLGTTYGLFNLAGNPKTAAVAVHNLFALMYDNSATSSTFTAGKLNYSITNPPATFGGFTHTGYRDVLFQASSGEWWLAMWNEQQLNTLGGAPLNVAPTSITLTLNEGPKSQVRIYDLLTGVTPIQTSTSVSSLAISLPPYPIFVQVVA